MTQISQLNPDLLEVLACPSCHSSLAVDLDRSELVCTNSECGLAYAVVDGIPNLLIDSARPTKTAATRRAEADEPTVPRIGG